jgi:hypothetical protein
MNIAFLRQLCLGFLISLIVWVGSSQANQGFVATSVQPGRNPSPISFPVQLAAPLNVGVSMVVHKVSKLNESDGSFNALIDLVLRWNDPSLAYEPVKEGTDRKQFNGSDATAFLSQIWTPGITVANLAGDAELREDGVMVYPDGTINYNQRISGTFRHNYDLSNFPFDKQGLPIELLSGRYDVNKVVFVHDQADVDSSGIRSDGIQLPGWKAKKDLEFNISRELGWDKSYYSKLETIITTKRNSKSHLPGVYFPFTLIMLVPTVLSLWAKGLKFEDSLNAWAGSILTLLALVFTVAIQYPLLQPDNIFYATFWTGFAFQLIMLLVVGTLYNPAVKYKLGDRYVVEEVSSVLRWIMPLGLLIVLGRMLTLSIYAYAS